MGRPCKKATERDFEKDFKQALKDDFIFLSSFLRKNREQEGLSFQIEVVVYPYLPYKLRHVRYEDHRALVLVERFCDDGEMAKIDMIRRLIEDEESRLLEDEAHK